VSPRVSRTLPTIEPILLTPRPDPFDDPAWLFEPKYNGYVYVFLAGTSASAAHVSGAAAVIESELPGNQTPAELTRCLLEAADPLPNPLLTANGRLIVFRALVCGSSSVTSK
jgi:subtilisin family serine protease